MSGFVRVGFLLLCASQGAPQPGLVSRTPVPRPSKVLNDATCEMDFENYCETTHVSYELQQDKKDVQIALNIGVTEILSIHFPRGIRVSEDMFDYLCQEYHEMMGEMLANSWQLPEEIGAIMADHQSALKPDDPLGGVRALVQLTDATLSLLGYGRPCLFDLPNMPAARRLQAAANPEFMKLLPSLPEIVEQQMINSQ